MPFKMTIPALSNKETQLFEKSTLAFLQNFGKD
jgi:hypothetical protein